MEIVAFERGHWTSYSACGIPYLIGGEVDSVDALIARTPEQFRETGVDARVRHEVTEIDLAAQRVEVHDLDEGRIFTMGFDQLLIGTGGRPTRPNLPGIDLPFLHGVQTLDDGVHLLDHAEEVHCSKVVVVGGGYIGLEIAEAFLHRGTAAVVLEAGPEVMATLDPDMGRLVRDAMIRHGVDVRTSCAVKGFDDGVVHCDAGDLEADLVVLAIGVAPETTLAKEAGLTLGVKGALRVDRRQRTSAPGVWGAGDCCESRHLVTGEPVHIALGTVANKQARVAGINIGGGYETFPGVLGTAITKVCDTEIGRTGLTAAEAERAGFLVVSRSIQSTTRAGYYPGAERVTLKMVAERGTGRMLGAQIVGGLGSAKRIDACAVAITAAMSVDDVVHLDLAYAPPFSGVWDPILVAARQLLKDV
jgi:NADPH-dependent 2,4-dienoyl-CoA reductase/sulfur reductase-like enzyme